MLVTLYGFLLSYHNYSQFFRSSIAVFIQSINDLINLFSLPSPRFICHLVTLKVFSVQLVSIMILLGLYEHQWLSIKALTFVFVSSIKWHKSISLALLIGSTPNNLSRWQEVIILRFPFLSFNKIQILPQFSLVKGNPSIAC